MKQGYKSDILIPRNASNRVSEKLDFENFPGEHAPGPPRDAKNFRNLSGLPYLQNYANCYDTELKGDSSLCYFPVVALKSISVDDTTSVTVITLKISDQTIAL